jgi:hypothetical protein
MSFGLATTTAPATGTVKGIPLSVEITERMKGANLPLRQCCAAGLFCVGDD